LTWKAILQLHRVSLKKFQIAARESQQKKKMENKGRKINKNY